MRDILGCGRGPLPAQSVPPTIGQGLNKYRRGHGGEQGTDGRVAKDNGQRVDGGWTEGCTHSAIPVHLRNSL